MRAETNKIRSKVTLEESQNERINYKQFLLNLKLL